MADNGDISKAAKKRAAKKARDSAFEEQQAAEATAAAAAAAAAPKAKGKAKAAPAPEAAAAPKSKAKAKAKSQPEPVAPEPKAQPKAAAGKAKAKAKAEVAPPPPAPAAPAPKAQGKQKAKGKAAPAPVVEEKPAEPANAELINYYIDDGTNADEWEAVPVQSKKDRRSQKGTAGEQKTAAQNQNVVGYVAPEAQGKNGKGSAGPSQAVAADVARILAMKGEAAEAPAEPAAAGKSVSTATVNVPENRVGVVIGPKGATIKLLQEETKTKIDTSGQDFTIVGEQEGVLKCEAAIKEMVAKGFCSLQYGESFSENIINVHPSCFPDLIGKQGAIVRKIKEALGVEVNFQDVPRGSPPAKKGKVVLAGKAENVEEAKEVINSIVMFQHHEKTHPGLVHEAIDIEPWSYKYIIGKAGSELKHIQNNWDVKVCIPREHSSFEQVLVVGMPDKVSKAKAYIDKVIWNAENNSKGRDKQDGSAEDPWGAEEEEEPWMKQYLYKRA